MWRLILIAGGVQITRRVVWPKVRPFVKGMQGESNVNGTLRHFKGKDYVKFHDILIPGGYDTTQIDHVMVSRHGIFVIETKNYSGDIVGNETDRTWYQTFPGHRGRARQFMNPLRQNEIHIKALRSLLRQYPNVPYFSIVVFGNKSEIPVLPNVLKMNVLKYALERRCQGEPVLTQDEVQDIGNIISRARIKGRKARIQHVTRAKLAYSAEKNVDRKELRKELEQLAKTARHLDFGKTSKEKERAPEQMKLTDAGAILSIRGRTASIETFFETAKRDANDFAVPKGGTFDFFICPFTGDSFPVTEAKNLYNGLWMTYLTRNPDLVQYLHEHRGEPIGDSFRCQRVLSEYIRDPEGFASRARDCAWYRNLAEKQNKKRPLNDQIRTAEQSGRQPHDTENQNQPHTDIDR